MNTYRVLWIVMVSIIILGQPCMAYWGKPYRLNKQGIHAYTKKDYDQAKASFTQAIALTP